MGGLFLHWNAVPLNIQPMWNASHWNGLQAMPTTTFTIYLDKVIGTWYAVRTIEDHLFIDNRNGCHVPENMALADNLNP